MSKLSQFIIDHRDPLTEEPYKYFTYYGDKTQTYRVEGRNRVEIDPREEEDNERITESNR